MLQEIGTRVSDEPSYGIEQAREAMSELQHIQAMMEEQVYLFWLAVITCLAILISMELQVIFTSTRTTFSLFLWFFR